MVSAGLISERVKRVCNAVRNEVISRGEGGGGASAKIDCRGVVDEGARAREKVCRREENPFAEEADTIGGCMEGDGGRISFVGDTGVPFRAGVEVADGALETLVFFFLLNGRKNDQSDSNCTLSNSDERAE